MVPPWDAASLSQRHRQAAAVLSAAGVCVAPSEYVAKRYEEAFDHLHVRVIPHGIDLLRMLRHRPSTSAEGGPTGSRTLTLGFLGTIVAQKGLGVLLKALAAIPDVPLKLMVAGHIHGDEVFRNDILQAVKADARIEMLGQLDAAGVVDMLSRMDLLCLPSLVPESYSLVLHEAAAAGVPALVSRLGAPEGFIAQTQAGLALEAGDPRAWSQAISRIAAEPSVLQRWRAALPLPIRIEEEAFLYESLYRQFRKSD